MASKVNISEMTLSVSTQNVHNLRKLLYRAYLFGIFKVSFKRLPYDTETYIGAFFDFQPLYYNKFIETELSSISLQIRPYKMKMRLCKSELAALIFEDTDSAWDEPYAEFPLSKQEEIDLYHKMDDLYHVAAEEMRMNRGIRASTYRYKNSGPLCHSIYRGGSLRRTFYEYNFGVYERWSKLKEDHRQKKYAQRMHLEHQTDYDSEYDTDEERYSRE